jgi:pantoate--beta-alanine ligase
VVLKLLTVVQPDAAYFGQKDYQQVRIIEQMIRDLNVPVRVKRCPTVREADGLALSSRNQYLDPEQRRQAATLFQALAEARQNIEGGERDGAVIRRLLAARIGTAPDARIDYADVVDAETLQSIRTVKGDVVVALAVKFGATRLIDNMMIPVPPGD